MPDKDSSELAGEIDRLRTELAALRIELTSEVRTRRVVIVEGDGFERVVLGARGEFGHVTVNGRSAERGSTCAELFAKRSDRRRRRARRARVDRSRRRDRRTRSVSSGAAGAVARGGRSLVALSWRRE